MHKTEIFILRIVSKLKLVLVFCNALVTGNHQTYFPQGGGGGGNMRHAEVSQRHIFFKDFVPKCEA